MTSREPYPDLEPGQVEPPLVESPTLLSAPHNRIPDRAAIAWLAFRAVVTTLIRRFALPNPRELMR